MKAMVRAGGAGSATARRRRNTLPRLSVRDLCPSSCPRERRSIQRADRDRLSAPFGVRSDVRTRSGVINVSLDQCDPGQALHELIGDDRVRIANAADVKQRVGLSRYGSVPQS